MARYRPVSEQFRIAIQSTVAQTQKLLVETAKREHARVMQTPPMPAIFHQTVDGRRGAPLESAKQLVIIEYPRLNMVVHGAMLALIDKSPFLTGDYIRGHRLFIDGVETDWKSDWFKNYRSGQEIAIANYIVYARKIEVGAMTMKVPGTDHVYEQATQVVRRRYGNMAKIHFTFRGIIPGGNRGMIGGRAGNSPDIRYPALIISEL